MKNISSNTKYDNKDHIETALETDSHELGLMSHIIPVIPLEYVDNEKQSNTLVINKNVWLNLYGEISLSLFSYHDYQFGLTHVIISAVFLDSILLIQNNITHLDTTAYCIYIYLKYNNLNEKAMVLTGVK